MKQEKTYIYQWLFAVCYVPIIAPSKPFQVYQNSLKALILRVTVRFLISYYLTESSYSRGLSGAFCVL